MKLKSMIGLSFGRLTVLKRAENGSGGNARWLCRCTCGGSTISVGTLLRSGRSASCGCLVRERMSKTMYRHGGFGTPEYNAWLNAKERCTDPTHPAWKNYGARGIKMCAEWQKSFTAFIEHIGPRPSGQHELDRKDNSKGYEPGNVRWVSRSVQAKNRRLRPRVGGRFSGGQPVSEQTEFQKLQSVLDRVLEVLSSEGSTSVRFLARKLNVPRVSMLTYLRRLHLAGKVHVIPGRNKNTPWQWSVPR